MLIVNPRVQGHIDDRGLYFIAVLFPVLCPVFSEPVITEGDIGIKILDDGWTIISEDSSWTAQYEHTILITDHGVDILTQEHN